jgi:hypothetical protein
MLYFAASFRNGEVKPCYKPQNLGRWFYSTTSITSYTLILFSALPIKHLLLVFTQNKEPGGPGVSK